MEAATIADVSEAHRNRDSTFGMDTPHSIFTKLRRSDTEVIFSVKGRVTSIPTAFHADLVLF